MENINSKYIFQQICSFINDENFILKLFAYSKSYQAKFNIKLINYQKQCILTRYFEKDFYAIINSISRGCIDEDIENYFFSKFGLKLKLNDIQNIIIEHFSTIKDKEIYVDISFPFLNVLSQQDYFEKNINISISISTYEEEKTIKKIEELKKANIKYPSLILFLHEHENLKKFPINYNQVKKLVIMEYFYNSHFDYDNIIYKKLFCDFNKENLTYLIIGGMDEKRRTEILINYINDFKSLEYLKLINFEFVKENVLKSCKLKTLIIEKCKNITFEENSLTSLTNLSLHNCKINNPYKTLCKLPNLEKCSLMWSRDCRSHDGVLYHTEEGDEDMDHLEYFN